MRPVAERSLGSIYAEISLRTSDFARKAAEVRRDVADLDRRLDGLARSSQEAGSRIAAGLTGLVGRISGAVTRLSGLLASIGAGVGAAWGLQFNMLTEQAQVSFETLLGSAEAARQRMQQILDFATATPFEVEGLLELDRRLQGLGIAAEDSLPTLRILGDAVAALGGDAQTLERVVTAIGQIATKGRVQAEELLQLAEANIPVYRILQEELGLTQEQLANIAREGISAERALEAILRGLDRLYGGQMEKQAKTLSGQISTLKDNLRQLLGIAMQPVARFLRETLLPTLNRTAETFLYVYRTAGLLAALRSILPESAVRRFAQAIELVRRAWETLTQSIRGNVNVFDILSRAVLYAAQIFNVFIRTVSWIIRNWSTLRNAIIGVATAFATWRILNTVIPLLVRFYSVLRRIAAGTLAFAAITNAAKAAMGGWKGILQALLSLGAGIGAYAAGDWIAKRLEGFVGRLMPDIEIPELPDIPDINAPPPPGSTVPRGVPDLDLGVGGGGGGGGSRGRSSRSGSTSAAASDPVSELLERIRRRIDIARARADIALQELRLKGISEESPTYRRRERELLMQVRARILEGVEQMRRLMSRLRGEARERAELEALQLQREANEILLQIRENTKSLRADFGLPFGVRPLRLFEFRARREGTRGITIATPQIVVHLPNIRGGIDAGKRFVDALEAALAGRLAADLRAGL